MDKNEYTAYLKERDEETRAERVDRWSKLEPAMYGKSLPSVVWDYLNVAVDLYIGGHFLPAILFCASILESALREKLGVILEEAESFNFAQMAILCKALKIINDEEKNIIDEVRQFRNALTHLDEEKMGKWGRRIFHECYRGWEPSQLEELGHYSALLPLNLGDIGGKTFQYVNFTRDLMSKFYGTEA